MKIVVVLLLAIITNIQCSNVNQCDINCEWKGGSNCVYTQIAKCKSVFGYKTLGTSIGKDKHKLIHLHNELRKKIRLGWKLEGRTHAPMQLPIPKFLPDLKWNETLAKAAQYWANNCKINYHDTCIYENGMGQNIAYEPTYGSITTIPVENLFNMWKEEVKYLTKDMFYQPYSFEEYNNKDIITGHFTQLIWAKTTDFGCGTVKYRKQDEEGTNVTYYSLVCNYWPPGNGEDLIYEPEDFSSTQQNENSSADDIDTNVINNELNDKIDKNDVESNEIHNNNRKKTHSRKNVEYQVNDEYYKELIITNYENKCLCKTDLTEYEIIEKVRTEQLSDRHSQSYMQSPECRKIKNRHTKLKEPINLTCQCSTDTKIKYFIKEAINDHGAYIEVCDFLNSYYATHK